MNFAVITVPEAASHTENVIFLTSLAVVVVVYTIWAIKTARGYDRNMRNISRLLK